MIITAQRGRPQDFRTKAFVNNVRSRISESNFNKPEDDSS